VRPGPVVLSVHDGQEILLELGGSIRHRAPPLAALRCPRPGRKARPRRGPGPYGAGPVSPRSRVRSGAASSAAGGAASPPPGRAWGEESGVGAGGSGPVAGAGLGAGPGVPGASVSTGGGRGDGRAGAGGVRARGGRGAGAG